MSSKAEPVGSANNFDRDIPGTFETDDDQYVDVSADLTPLARALKARKSEYIRRRQIRIKVGTWNVAAISGTEKDIGDWFVGNKGAVKQVAEVQAGEIKDGSPPANTLGKENQKDKQETTNVTEEEVGMYVLGLQEIVDVSSPSEALRPYVDPTPSSKWKTAVQKALPMGYQLIADQQLVGLLLLVYASPSIAPTISSVSTTSVGTGLMGYMGNKGAVTTRMLLGETTRLIFVNCHLAAGADKGSLERRNWDASQIVGRTRFGAIEDEYDDNADRSESIGTEDFAFWFGDLNYRLDDIPGDDVRRLLQLHTQNEFDQTRNGVDHSQQENQRPSSRDRDEDSDSSDKTTENPSQSSIALGDAISMIDNDLNPEEDPASLQTTLLSLLPHDQLQSQQRQKKAFHDGWREGDIRFLPTYKYDIGSVGMFDSSEKQRGPSWCDRILFRTRHDRREFHRKEREMEEAKRRDEEMKARGLDKLAEENSVLFDYDPDADGANDHSDYDENEDVDEQEPDPDEERIEDTIELSHYTSHQGVLSSDHKPLDAGFTLTYDAVVPELKAKVHQEVARELDKAENEARPGITIVVDHQSDDSKSTDKRDIADDPNTVSFGEVPYDVPVSRQLTIANTSGVPSTFGFGDRPTTGNGSVLPPWLLSHVDWPEDQENAVNQYTLAPGESVSVELTVHIRDIDLVRQLNTGTAKIEDVLVFRVTDGRDYFVPIHGRWLQTCFGRSLSELTRIPEGGARKLDTKTSRLLSEPQGNMDGIRLSAPRELFGLTEAITDLVERSIADWSMTKQDSDEEKPPWLYETHGLGWPFKAETWTLGISPERGSLLAGVREALDTGKPIATVFAPEIPSLHRLEVLAETLQTFLRSLRDGIVPEALWEQMERHILAREKTKNLPVQSAEDSQAWILEILAQSPAHSVSFTFLTFMLARIANETAPQPANNPASPVSSIRTPSMATIPGASTPSEIPSAPASPSVPPSSTSFSNLKRRARTFSKSSDSASSGSSVPPTSARRQNVDRMLATIFADLIFSSSIPVPAKEKDRRAWEERKRSVVMPFLNAGSRDGVS